MKTPDVLGLHGFLLSAILRLFDFRESGVWWSNILWNDVFLNEDSVNRQRLLWKYMLACQLHAPSKLVPVTLCSQKKCTF